MLASAARPLAVELAALLRIAGAAPPASHRTADIYAVSAVTFDLDGPALAHLSALRQNPAIASLVQRRNLTVSAVGSDLATGTSEPVAASRLEAAVYRAVERAGAGHAPAPSFWRRMFTSERRPQSSVAAARRPPERRWVMWIPLRWFHSRVGRVKA